METVKELTDEAKVLIPQLLPPIEHGENSDVERLYNMQDDIEKSHKEACKQTVLDFVEKILHGDDEHKQWLRDEAKSFIN